MFYLCARVCYSDLNSCLFISYLKREFIYLLDYLLDVINIFKYVCIHENCQIVKELKRKIMFLTPSHFLYFPIYGVDH